MYPSTFRKRQADLSALRAIDVSAEERSVFHTRRLFEQMVGRLSNAHRGSCCASIAPASALAYDVTDEPGSRLQNKLRLREGAQVLEYQLVWPNEGSTCPLQ